MGFFDLNIPYHESSTYDNHTHKTARLKIVVKAMELGYTGIAYNRMMKGVMSDQDRCSISLLSLSSLLKVAPSLSSSVNFHRNLLGVPCASPFRQYTRLTVCADTVSQCQVLNSGNPVLKSYDLVAVRPLNQSAFDHACEKAEVDIISIDFAEKVPFRLKLPMVKTAVKRGVYFEINYSNLIVDVQLRRQMISNTKLLVDWTHGKNLIVSSGAPSVNGLRGPYDVANLASLLGLSMERAKVAVSKSCRTLIANALRKKHFYKEIIKIESISSGNRFDSVETWSQNLLEWDPISSGEGDLHLVDMEKSVTASSKVPKAVKVIDFASVIDSIPACGFQFKDAALGVQAVLQAKDDENTTCATETVKVLDAADEMSEKLNRLDVPSPGNDPASLENPPPEQQSYGCENLQKLDSHRNMIEVAVNTEDMGTLTAITVEEVKNSVGSDDILPRTETERDNQYLGNSVSSCQTDILLSKETVKCQTLIEDIELYDVGNADAGLNGVTKSAAFDFPACQIEGSKLTENDHADSVVTSVVMREVTVDIDIKDQDDTALPLSTTPLRENATGREHSEGPLDDHVFSNQNPCQKPFEDKVAEDTSGADHDTLEVVKVGELMDGDGLGMPKDNGLVTNQTPILESCNEMTVKDDSSMTNHEAEEFMNDKQRHGKNYRGLKDGAVTDQIQILGSHDKIKLKNGSSVEICKPPEEVEMEEEMSGDEPIGPILVQCTSGKDRRRARKPHRGFLFPLKRLLSPVSFKKKSHKLKHRNKGV